MQAVPQSRQLAFRSGAPAHTPTSTPAPPRPWQPICRVPYYHAVKLLLLIWLQSPAYKGAARLYVEGLRPWLARVQPQLDDFLAALLRSLVRRGWGGCTGCCGLPEPR